MKSVFVPLLKGALCVSAALAAPVTAGGSLAAAGLLGIGAYNGLKSTGNAIRDMAGEETDEIYVTYLNFEGDADNRILGALANSIPDTPLELFSYKTGTKISHACMRIVGPNGIDTIFEISGVYDGGEILDKCYYSGGLISGTAGSDTLYLLMKKESNSYYRNNCISKTYWGKKRMSMESIKKEAKRIFANSYYHLVKENCQDFSKKLAKYARG